MGSFDHNFGRRAPTSEIVSRLHFGPEWAGSGDIRHRIFRSQLDFERAIESQIRGFVQPYCGCIIDLCFVRLAVAMNESVTQLKDTTANPAPLGLLGFGMTTVLLNLHNAGFYELNSMILAMGIFYGGAAQIFAGMMEWRKGNTFATTAFLSYGLFWFSLVALIVIGKVGWAAPSNQTAMAAYLFMWGLFTAVMFVGTFRLHVAGQVVFGSLTILFFLLAIGDFINAGPDFRRFTGYEGVFCGFSAIYAGLAQVLNEVYGKVILPLGAVMK
jgi:uncharacterized protein